VGVEEFYKLSKLSRDEFVNDRAERYPVLVGGGLWTGYFRHWNSKSAIEFRWQGVGAPNRLKSLLKQNLRLVDITELLSRPGAQRLGYGPFDVKGRRLWKYGSFFFRTSPKHFHFPVRLQRRCIFYSTNTKIVRADTANAIRFS